MREYFDRNDTRAFRFRIARLRELKSAIVKYEQQLTQALHIDLKKSAEESYATEIGLVITEINVALRNLKEWMHPVSTSTNLVNLPSSGKIYRDPLGVVLIIAPWNYPLQLLLIPLVGAISGGNCSVLKPSEYAPATASVIIEMIEETFSPQYIQVFPGVGSEIIPSLMSEYRFDHIFYTGSIEVGRHIYTLAANQLVPVTLELGGKSPAIVHKDANLKIAARRIVFGKFLNTGQTCIAPDYLLVDENIRDPFLSALSETINEFYTNDPSTSADYGKIINEKHFDRLLGYLSEGTVYTGGKSDRSNLFISPTIMVDIIDNSRIMNEEIFGPLLPVLFFKSIEEARSIVLKNANPLAFYLFTNSKTIQDQWIETTAFGGGCINNADWQFANHHLPFGGVGSSGIGSYHGKYSFDTFTRKKPVMKTPLWFDPSIKYPPFKGRLGLFKWLFR